MESEDTEAPPSHPLALAAAVQANNKDAECWLYRLWISQGARYAGFLGQSRPLTYNVGTTQGSLSAHNDVASSSAVVLPYDITEGPMPPMKTESARQRQLEQLRIQSRLEYPMVFDNTRWTPMTETANSRSTSSTKHKFFDALVKPCVSISSCFWLLVTSH